MDANLPALGDEDRLRLSAHRLLHGLAGTPRDELIARFRAEDVAAGVHLLEEGESNRRLFFVLKGAVSVKLPRHAHRVSDVRLATLGAGEIFGEYSLFDGQPVSAAVYATEPTRLAWIDRADLEDFLARHHDEARRFYESAIGLLVARLRDKNAELDVVTIG